MDDSIFELFDQLTNIFGFYYDALKNCKLPVITYTTMALR